MVTAPRQILLLGLMLAAMIAAAAALSGERRDPVGLSAPSLPRAGEPLAGISARQFDLRWSGVAGDLVLAGR